MGKGRVDPRKYGMSRGQVQGSWWFVVNCPDGSTSLCHYSPVVSIAEVIRKNADGGDPAQYVAKYGSRVLDHNRCLEDYKINLNGSRALGDFDWDGKLAVINISHKSVMGAILNKFGKKKKNQAGSDGSSSSSGGASTQYTFVLTGASGLVAADRSGTSDPYVVLSFTQGGAAPAKSSAKKKCLDATWDEEELSLRGPSHDEAVLKVQVFDANVIQKDVLLGEAEVPMDKLYSMVRYHTYSMRSVLVPLAPQGWVSLAWKTDNQSLITDSPDLVWDPSYGFAHVDTQTQCVDEWHTKKVQVVGYHSSLLSVVRFLELKKYKAKVASPEQVFKIAAQFGSADKWSDLKSRWTPELLQDVGIFVLEVKTGHTADEVKELLEVVKNTPSITEVHLLDFDGSDAMEHGIRALKGAPHITKLKYSDDQSEVNDEGVKSLAELVVELPALETLVLVPSEGMLKSQHLSKLLETVAGLKLKSLQLWQLPPDKLDVDLSTAIKKAAAESLSIRFKYAFSFEETGTWHSIINSLKDSTVRRLEIDHDCLGAEPTKQLVQAVLEMPALEELKVRVNEKALNETLPLLSSTKLKGLNIYVDKETDADTFLEKAASNTSLERLELGGDIKMSSDQDRVIKLCNENATLKVLHLDASYSFGHSWCNPHLFKAFAANTTLQRAVLSFFKIYDTSFMGQVREVADEWQKRGAHFAQRHEC